MNVCVVIHNMLVIMLETRQISADKSVNIIEELLVQEEEITLIDNVEPIAGEEVQKNVCMEAALRKGALHGYFEVTAKEVIALKNIR